jgi:hypothetical protein
MKLYLTVLLLLTAIGARSQTITGTDALGNATQLDERGQRFNPFDNDSTKKDKVVPKGIYVWTVDRKLGDIREAEVDTLPHLYPQSTLGMGKHGEYNTIGTNYSARLSRIFIDRSEQEQFLFTQLYDQVQKTPDQWHFTNTLSPITNLGYDNCGDKNNGEDHLDAQFAVNAGKALGLGFDVNYAYARGYFQNQSTSHFNATFYTSYLGDQYQLHALFSTRHQKASENGGIGNDVYITHPESSNVSYSDDEIPTILSTNWNRNNSQHFFLTHRYRIGFYRKVKMTEEEIKARQFAEKSKNEMEKEKRGLKGQDDKLTLPEGRPTNAKIAGKEPELKHPTDSLTADTTRIKVDSKEVADSLLAKENEADSLNALMKDEFVPVTSFIHTLELDNYDHIYQAYNTPSNYYANTYYDRLTTGYIGDSIYDQTKMFNIKNTVGLALLEGFNKWAKAGVKAFATHELRRIDMPQINADGYGYLERWTEHNISVGGRLSKTQGKTLHYGLTAETWLVGEDAGQLKADFNTDLNFPLWKDTVRLEARAYFHRLNPTFFERNYHSKHLWWDNNNLDKTTRTRIEGIFSYSKTHTKLRVAIEEIQNYTYLGMSYNATTEARSALSASLLQHSGNINVLTAQIDQQLALGPLHWDNIITYQSSSNQDILPLPDLNVFSNLYLQFMIAKVLRVELGASATFFTHYYAPDYCPQLNQFAIQQNADSRIEMGNYPIVDVYANLHLKHARFFIMMNNLAGTSFNRMVFLTPHYPLNRSVLHFGVSWNFFN